MSDEENKIDGPDVREMLKSMFGATPINAVALCSELLGNNIAAIMQSFDDKLPTEKMLDALFVATSTHIGAALTALEADGRFREGKTVAGCIDDMMAEFGKRVLSDYEECKQRAIEEGLFGAPEETESENPRHSMVPESYVKGDESKDN